MPERPIVRIRLRSVGMHDGEIPLSDLTRIADETQKLIRRIGRELVGQRGPGRAETAVEQATALSLVGLARGSTILEVAGVASVENDVLELDLPLDLSDRSLALWVGGLEALAAPDDRVPILPVGFDSHMVGYLDDWLRPLRRYQSVGLTSSIGPDRVTTSVVPETARSRLRTVNAQPSLPWVSSTDQALTGYLYQVNLSTGTFSIRDADNHVIRINVPPDLRTSAAQHIGTRVQAVGRPEVDDTGRLADFHVVHIVPQPGPDRGQQGEFFGRQDLWPNEALEGADPAPDVVSDHYDLAIEGVTDEEADAFEAAIRDVRL